MARKPLATTIEKAKAERKRWPPNGIYGGNQDARWIGHLGEMAAYEVEAKRELIVGVSGRDEFKGMSWPSKRAVFGDGAARRHDLHVGQGGGLYDGPAGTAALSLAASPRTARARAAASTTKVRRR